MITYSKMSRFGHSVLLLRKLCVCLSVYPRSVAPDSTREIRYGNVVMHLYTLSHTVSVVLKWGRCESTRGTDSPRTLAQVSKLSKHAPRTNKHAKHFSLQAIDQSDWEIDISQSTSTAVAHTELRKFVTATTMNFLWILAFTICAATAHQAGKTLTKYKHC